MKKRIISFFTSLIMILSLAMVMLGIRASAYSGACGTGWQCQVYAYECLDTIFQNAKYIVTTITKTLYVELINRKASWRHKQTM